MDENILRDCEVHTSDTDESDEEQGFRNDPIELPGHEINWDNIELDWNNIEAEVQNIEREHERRSDTISGDLSGMRVDQSSSDNGGEDEDTKEDNIWNSDVELKYHYSDEETSEKEAIELQSSFNEADLVDPKLKKVMKFSSRALFKEAIFTHAILTKRDLKITKNEVQRMHAKCKSSKKCKWKCHANKVKDEETYYIHSYNPIHTCNETNKVSMMKSKWLSKTYLHKFISYPDINLKGFRDEVTRELDVNFSKQQAYRARQKALESINEDLFIFLK